MNTLFERLKTSPMHSPTSQPEQISKSKYKNVQGVLNSLMDEMDKVSDDRKGKLEAMTERLMGLQSMMNEDVMKRE